MWAKLPAPKAPTRRVVQLLLPLHKALAAGSDSEEEGGGRPAAKRQKKAQGEGKQVGA